MANVSEFRRSSIATCNVLICRRRTFRGDKSEHPDLPLRLGSQVAPDHASRLVVAIPNYRLSHHPDHPERISTVHPTHELDAIRSLLWLTESENIGRYLGSKAGGSPRIRSIYLAGHSCGAHILYNMMFLLPNVQISPGTPTTAGSDITWTSTERTKMLELLPKIKGLAFLDGIYDLNDLLDEYPGYEFFVEKAFGTDGEAGEDWDKACVPKQALDNLSSETCDWLKSQDGPKLFVAHAMEDELLSERQSLGWYKWLVALVGESGRLVYDNSTLIGSHDGSLQHEGLGQFLAKVVNRA